MRLWVKLALALVVAGTIPLVLAAGSIVQSDSERLAESARAYHLATAEVVLGEVRGLVARALAEMRAIGGTLGRIDEPADRREAAARAQLLGAELVDHLAIYDHTGVRLVLMRAGVEGAGAAGWAPPERLTPEVRPGPDEAHRAWPVVTRPDGSLALPLVIPVLRADGAIYAWLLSDVTLAPLSTFVKQLSERHYGGDGRVRLVDDRLQVLATGDDTLGRDLAGRPVASGLDPASNLFRHEAAHTIDFVTLEGEPRVGAIVPLPELRWAAIVEQDREVAYAAIDATWRTAGWIGGGFVLVAILLGLVAGRRLARPVEAIAAATGKVASGDFSVRVPDARKDEIGQTARAFNTMTADLVSYRDRLVGETRARENLSRFLSPEVVERIMRGQGQGQGRDALALGGERKEITVLFADVVAFTQLADEREPEVAVAILNELFTIVTEIVFQHGGIIDKFIGDCVMAIWGAPEARPDDARNAVRAAEAMLRWLEVGNAKWRKQVGRDIELAIGIHSGVAVVGNIGSEKRMEYTAIGDAVNVAARLERLARPGQVLMTRETMQRVADEFASRSIGTYDVVGRAHPSELFVLSEP
ncbi:MAG: HAMP domain-containing protein [Deltaproteobacteria bacterium]|nr:HAMP domain-containing protein [Deltaproteobacteria bacterium]